MAILKAFRGLRPPKEIVQKIVSRPYDVLNSDEARKESEGNIQSLYHIIKPEIDFPAGKDEHEMDVYEKAKENFGKFRQHGWLVQDEKKCLYIYAQTMGGRTQYGIVGCAGVEDYLNGVIKKHELTRKEKEEDRMTHVRVTNANIEPVFFAYKSVPELDSMIIQIANSKKAEYDFTSEDEIDHKFWIIEEEDTIHKIMSLFARIPYTYVADGHHRTAAAALVGLEKKKMNSNHKGDEEYNFFLAVHFPDSQLSIQDYNRVVKDLNGLTPKELLEKLKSHFAIEKIGQEIYKPQKMREMSMYLDGEWYKLTPYPDNYSDDPIGTLDVTVLSKFVLDEILSIKDLRTDKRIDFVGGIRGLGELKKRVDSGEMNVAFALYPVSMKQLMDIADSGNIMPPKTTWFEPKLRSGLIVHLLD